MIKKWKLMFPILALLTLLSTSARADGLDEKARELWGPNFRSTYIPEIPQRLRPPSKPDPAARIRYWNEVALSANALDHTPESPGEMRMFGEQYGPGRTARAFAIVHIAIFDAVNAIAGGYQSYSGLDYVGYSASMDAAIAQAAHDTLSALYPSQRGRFDDLLGQDLARISDGSRKTRGTELGRQAAAAILALRANDYSDYPDSRWDEGYYAGDGPGVWSQDPVSLIPIVLGDKWKYVTPFVMESADQFQAPPPPPLDSFEYTRAFYEAKWLGGDGIVTPTIRTKEQTIKGIYWSYDGTPGLGTPPRLYNQIAVEVAGRMKSDAVELARLLALVNVAMADAGIASWESKYYYTFWRPVTAIREADAGTGPTGSGDGNYLTTGDPNWTPLGAQASNLLDFPNFTPPFPAYTSGHAAFGGALFQVLRTFYRTDKISFTFVSDEFNGVTRDNKGIVRPRIPRTFYSLSQAEEENGQSRIYLGIHWAFDKTEGIAQGRKIANYVFENAFRPLSWK